MDNIDKLVESGDLYTLNNLKKMGKIIQWKHVYQIDDIIKHWTVVKFMLEWACECNTVTKSEVNDWVDELEKTEITEDSDTEDDLCDILDYLENTQVKLKE